VNNLRKWWSRTARKVDRFCCLLLFVFCVGGSAILDLR
jgi:hypothetical protein